jgi:hypothetical protein
MKTKLLFFILSIVLITTSCVETSSRMEKTATPIFNRSTGIIPPSTTVTISCATSGATVEYWTSLNSTHQAGLSYAVGAACTLYAQATKSGYEASEVASASYTIDQYKLQIDYTKGSTSARRLYAAWVADDSGVFVQNLFMCQNLHAKQNIVDRKALPYWRTTANPESEVDAVSGASLSDSETEKIISLPERAYKGSLHLFTVYFEIDRSWDSNGWWTDQPAILYAADVDLDDVATASVYYLTAQGWSRNAGPATAGATDGGNANKFATNPNPATSALGVLVSEFGYLKDAPNGDGTAFGAAYGSSSEMDATNMTGSIKLTITKVE